MATPPGSKEGLKRTASYEKLKDKVADELAGLEGTVNVKDKIGLLDPNKLKQEKENEIYSKMGELQKSEIAAEKTELSSKSLASKMIAAFNAGNRNPGHIESVSASDNSKGKGSGMER